MARPKMTDAQKAVAWGMFKGIGSRPTAIHDHIIGEFGEAIAVSLRTVNTWMEEFKQRMARLDEPFQWSMLHEYQDSGWGLHWEASDYILEMLSWVTLMNQMSHERAYGVGKPTVRDVLWWWRVHTAAPDLGRFDVYVIASAFVFREASHYIMQKPLELGDLEAFIAWKPWKDEARKEAYLAMVEMEIAPAPSRFGVDPDMLPFEWDASTKDVRIKDIHLETHEQKVMYAAYWRSVLWPVPERPHLLPSQMYQWDSAEVADYCLYQPESLAKIQSFLKNGMQSNSAAAKHTLLSLATLHGEPIRKDQLKNMAGWWGTVGENEALTNGAS